MAQGSTPQDQHAGTLIPASISSEFQQQGTIDWVDLSKHSINFSLDILARLTSNRVQALAFSLGLAISTHFIPSPEGRQNIEITINSVGAFNGLNNALWLGFGHRSLARVAAITREGGVCLALCAALSEGYDEDQAAGIFSALLELHKPPQTLTPSLREWRDLLRAFQGSFSRTTFPLILGQLRTLTEEEHPFTYETETLQHFQFGNKGPTIKRNSANPKAIAEALWAIGSVSRKDLATVKIIGGPDVAWLAAISKWLFCLPFSMKNQEGVVRDTNCRPGEEQIHLVYQSKDVAEGYHLDHIKTFRLDTAGELFVSGHEISRAMIGGRSSWEHCLSSTFGSAFDQLTGIPNVIGTIIGSVARIFSSHRERPDNLGSVRHYNFAAAHGNGFVQHIITQFPELLSAKDSMEKAVNSPLNDATCQLEANLARLIEICSQRKCFICNRTRDEEFREYCLPTLVGTIVRLGSTSSLLSIPENLYPSRTGLQLVYQDLHWDPDEKSARILQLFRPVGLEEVLTEAFLILTGRRPQPNIGYTISAASRLGICIYIDSLCQLSDEGPPIACFHVIPGKIEYQGRPYTHIADRKDLVSQPQPWPTHDNPIDIMSAELWSSFNEVSLLLTDCMDSLDAAFEVRSKRTNPILFGPKEFLFKVAGTARPSCTRRSCRQVDIKVQKVFDDSYRQISALGMEIEVFSGKRTQRCATLMMREDATARKQRQEVCLYGFDACLSCCIRYTASSKCPCVFIILDESESSDHKEDTRIESLQ